TVLDPGGGPGALDDYVAIVGQLGGRVFFSPPYRSHDIFTDAEGRHYYEERPDKGRPGLKAGVEFIKKFHGAHNGRLQGILNPAQAETAAPSASSWRFSTGIASRLPSFSPMSVFSVRALHLAIWRSPAATRELTIRWGAGGH